MSLDYDWLAEAKAPLVTIDDCYDVLDVWHYNRQPDFSEVQRAFRHKLYKYNPDKEGLPAEALEYRSLKTEQVKEAYRRVCDALGENPEEGLTETEESLIAERDSLIKGWEGHWCGTPMMNIEFEYGERIEALKNKTKSSE